jgi:hypothetical protein
MNTGDGEEWWIGKSMGIEVSGMRRFGVEDCRIWVG